MLLFSTTAPFCFPPWSSCHRNKRGAGCQRCSTCPCSPGSGGEESGRPSLRSAWAGSELVQSLCLKCLWTAARSHCLPCKWSSTPHRDEMHSVLRGGRNGAVSPPWRSISDLRCAMINWTLDHASPTFPSLFLGFQGVMWKLFRGELQGEIVSGGKLLCFWAAYVGLCFAHHPPVAAVWYTS